MTGDWEVQPAMTAWAAIHNEQQNSDQEWRTLETTLRKTVYEY